jgi:acyl dehydratase
VSVDVDAVLAARLHWEDFAPGFTYATPARTITESDVVAFASLTGDFNRIHTDAEFARSAAFGQRIAHGLLVASISVGLNTRSVVNQLLEPSLIALLDNHLRFPRPTFIGDTVSVRVEVVERAGTSNPDRGVVTFRRSTLNQHGETVCESTVKLLVRRST